MSKEVITVQQTIEGTDDAELDAIKFIQLTLRNLDAEAVWRVLDYVERRKRSELYYSENVAERAV